MENRQIVLTRYADGVEPSPAHFALRPAAMPVAKDGEVLLQTLYLSVDPYMRGCMTGVERHHYFPQFTLQAPIVSLGVARVIESKHERLRAGDVVEGMMAWQDYSASGCDGALLAGAGLRKLDRNIRKLSHAVGALGMPGMNAYFGTLDVARPRPGDTMLISGAAGAIGALAGQIARLRGARVIGLAGSEQKRRFLTEQLGFDHALDYKSSTLKDEIVALCPNGPDIYFDNVGGATSQAVMWTMRKPARIVECGQVSTYNDKGGGWLVDIWPIHANQLRMESFVGNSYAEFFPAGIAQLAHWIEAGKVQALETIYEGLEAAPEAFIGLLKGNNLGKMVVRVNGAHDDAFGTGR